VVIIRWAGNNKVFGHLPTAVDIHNMRAVYAAEYYHEIVRPVDTINRRDVYFGRGIHAGKRYDRTALMTVSRALGHSRCDVIVEHYSQYFR
jgi:hypothetical protein